MGGTNKSYKDNKSFINAEINFSVNNKSRYARSRCNVRTMEFTFLQSTFKIFHVQLKPIMVFDDVTSLYVYSKMEEQESRNE